MVKGKKENSKIISQFKMIKKEKRKRKRYDNA